MRACPSEQPGKQSVYMCSVNIAINVQHYRFRKRQLLTRHLNSDNGSNSVVHNNNKPDVSPIFVLDNAAIIAKLIFEQRIPRRAEYIFLDEERRVQFPFVKQRFNILVHHVFKKHTHVPKFSYFNFSSYKRHLRKFMNGHTMAKNTLITTVDTFSGIGGVSVALKDVAKTVLYCEVNPYCQRVLSARMRDGKLDRAPIHGDIKTLHLPDAYGVEMITGGSPCTDVSSIGLKQGIVDGPQSSLFFEILRLADENAATVKVLFLENVANILRCGVKDVITELTINRDFDMYWTCKSAASMGAPHIRNRWFCLAIKRGHTLDHDSLLSQLERATPPVNWDNAAQFDEPTIAFRPSIMPDAAYDQHWVQRSQCLGNTVVPCVVRSAFTSLLKMYRMAPGLKDLLSAECGQSVEAMVDAACDPPETCAIVDGCCIEVPLGNKRPKSGSEWSWVVKHPLTNKDVIMTNLPTPRHGVCHASAVTERSMHDLPTVLVNNEKSKAYAGEKLQAQGVEPEATMEHRQMVVPNVKYIEWMMGYEKDWTRVEPITKTENENKQQGHAKQPKSNCSIDKSIDASRRTNALNLFHKERHTHMNIREVCKLWRELSNEERKAYSERAKQVRLGVGLQALSIETK